MGVQKLKKIFRYFRQKLKNMLWMVFFDKLKVIYEKIKAFCNRKVSLFYQKHSSIRQKTKFRKSGRIFEIEFWYYSGNENFRVTLLSPKPKVSEENLFNKTYIYSKSYEDLILCTFVPSGLVSEIDPWPPKNHFQCSIKIPLRKCDHFF